jgi:hypothetical protein
MKEGKQGRIIKRDLEEIEIQGKSQIKILKMKSSVSQIKN